MIGLLMLAHATVTVSADDRKEFAEYRTCILAEVAKAPREGSADAALKAALEKCKTEHTATALDMAGEDLERLADGSKPRKFKMEQRLEVLDRELAAEAVALFENKDPSIARTADSASN